MAMGKRSVPHPVASLRAELGLEVEELAEILGVLPKVVQSWDAGGYYGLLALQSLLLDLLCSAVSSRSGDARTAWAEQLRAALRAGPLEVLALLQAEVRRPVRLRLVPVNHVRARLVLQRGGQEVEELGTRVGVRWTWKDPKRGLLFHRLLPRLEAELRLGGSLWGAALREEGFVTPAPSVLSAENGTRQRSGGPPP